MCLTVKENAEVKTNKKPKLAWKYINKKDKELWESPIFIVPHVCRFGQVCDAMRYNHSAFQWEVLKHLSVEVGMVFHGFHSCKNPLSLWWHHNSLYREGSRMHPCVIPAGCETIEGRDSDIASTKIIVFRNIFQAIKYCRTNKK